MLGVRVASALAGVALLGCATYFPANDRLAEWSPRQGYRAAREHRADASDELVLALAFSGGGTRAAAFAFGVLEELAESWVEIGGQRRRLFDEIDSASGVSGGSFVTAFLALEGERMLDSFPERFLERNIQRSLLLRLLWPINWLKLLSSYWARSDLAAAYYDGALFGGATFGDLIGLGHPFAQIHATDLTTGAPFAFTQEQFDYLCSDLSSYPIARAVAASSAVPLLLSPITLRNYPECAFEPPVWVRDAADGRERTLDRAYLNAKNLLSYRRGDRRFVRLVDGGISDNLGVRGPFEAWFHRTFEPPPARRPGERARWVVLVVINAQTAPDAEWDRTDLLPSLSSVLDAVTSVQINRYNFETIELLQRTFELWNERSASWDPPLRYHLIELSFLDVKDPEERRALNRMGTSLSLKRSHTLRLRRAGRDALREHEVFQSLLDRIGLEARP